MRVFGFNGYDSGSLAGRCKKSLRAESEGEFEFSRVFS